MIDNKSTSSDKEPSVVKEVAQTLNVVLPMGSIPFFAKIVALLTSAGGFGIMADIFSDIIQPYHVNLYFYFLRLLVGMAMICVGYGILKNKEWTVWVYGTITLVGLFVNPIIAILPLLVTIYLYRQGRYFDPHWPQKFLQQWRR
jgi:hypothetical protein